MVSDKDANINLVPEALKLLFNPLQQKVLSENISRYARPQAAENIVRELIDIIR
jgi:UDP-N-acetylglucosamine--N-acetylmuramyl-(pentapeptide) pyrophosphoryl-undecaprenol N-acetylglucosamine transferase